MIELVFPYPEVEGNKYKSERLQTGLINRKRWGFIE